VRRHQIVDPLAEDEEDKEEKEERQRLDHGPQQVAGKDVHASMDPVRRVKKDRRVTRRLDREKL
jgi:hypothetical protein